MPHRTLSKFLCPFFTGGVTYYAEYEPFCICPSNEIWIIFLLLLLQKQLHHKRNTTEANIINQQNKSNHQEKMHITNIYANSPTLSGCHPQFRQRTRNENAGWFHPYSF